MALTEGQGVDRIVIALLSPLVKQKAINDRDITCIAIIIIKTVIRDRLLVRNNATMF